MTGKPNLSVLLTTHAEFEHLEFLLQSLLRFRKPDFEIILVNDDAETEIADALRSMIRISEDERVYLFEHQSKHGRGQSLNEALLQSSAPLVWAPLRADRLNEQLMAETIRRFKSDPAAFWLLDASLPQSVSGWIEAVSDSGLPDDSCFLWNRNVLLDGDFFFNPFLNNLICPELALRLSKQNAWHRTDPFFVLGEDQLATPESRDTLEILFSIFRICTDDEQRNSVLNAIEALKHKPTVSQLADDLIMQARKLLLQGDAVKALDAVNRLLKKKPGHKEANRLKITLLEKLRRHVEAAELKHSLQKKPEKPPEQKILFESSTDKESDDSETGLEETEKIEVKETTVKNVTELSVVIPTTGDSRPLLQQCLAHLEKSVKNLNTELIIIDNASIDDTFDYLEQLKEKEFLHCKVITNQSNRGFAASVNQGIDLSSGKKIMVMHNDVFLDEHSVETLIEAIEVNGYDVVGPFISSGNGNDNNRPGTIEKVKKLDSCCLVFTADTNIRFDSRYELCFYETDDFFRRVAESNGTVGRVHSALAEHLKSETTTAMGLKLEPDLKWKNALRYHQYWNDQMEYTFPPQCDPPACFEKIGLPPDPWNPDEKWLRTVEEYLTREVRTIIRKTDWNPSELYTIITSLMFADQRDLMRLLEDKMNDLEIPETILMLLISFYYRRNIFSRCK
ncbi:MAG: glycosyltransferase, partial [Balneolaceae bacterium]